MTDNKMKDELRNAILLLDCALMYFEREARREAASNENATLRQITWRERLKSVERMVFEIGPKVGYPPDA
jgi:protein subunit release factor B